MSTGDQDTASEDQDISSVDQDPSTGVRTPLLLFKIPQAKVDRYSYTPLFRMPPLLLLKRASGHS